MLSSKIICLKTAPLLVGLYTQQVLTTFHNHFRKFINEYKMSFEQHKWTMPVSEEDWSTKGQGHSHLMEQQTSSNGM